MATTTEDDLVTVPKVLTDLGWFSMVFAIAVGGPSYLSMAQSVFVDYQLLRAMGWIVDGYNAVLEVTGGIFEPFLTPIISFVGDIVRLPIELQPAWRQLFVLGMVFALSIVRSTWMDRRYGRAAVIGVLLTLVVLFCACISSLSPLDTWWKNAWAAFWMTLVVAAMFSVSAVRTKTTFLQKVISREPSTTDRVLLEATDMLNKRYVIHVANFLGCFVAAALAGLLSLIPSIGAGGAFVAFSCVLIWAGIDAVISGGLLRKRSSIRLGVTILGGFLAASLIVLCDRAVSAIS